jgi:lipopolysaccharide export system permease protein
MYADVLGAVAFVTVAFLALFFFIDFVDELNDVGKAGYKLQHAALYCALLVPGHFYELFPITVLIGAIFAMARLAQSSEFTILRTSGLGPGRALSLLAVLGLSFAAITFVVGDYVAPYFDRVATNLRAGVRGGMKLEGMGAWLKDRRDLPGGGERMDSINVGRVAPDASLEDVRIYEFDTQGQLLTRLAAKRGHVGGGKWVLEDVQRTEWPVQGADTPPRDTHLGQLEWPSTLTPAVVSAAVATVRSMSTIDLYRYASHLSENEQAAQRYEIQFWKKALYPFACLVMMGLALPFAYLHARRGGMSLMVFGGILLGISFVLLNNVATHLGLLQNWIPWVAAGAPSAVYLLLSLAAFRWLVRNR